MIKTPTEHGEVVSLTERAHQLSSYIAKRTAGTWTGWDLLESRTKAKELVSILNALYQWAK